MSEQVNLGLGIQLSLNDQFTASANGAVGAMGNLETKAKSLRGTLNSEMQAVDREFRTNMINLQNTMFAGFSLAQVGSSVTKGGDAIVNTIKGIGSSVIETGRFFETSRASMKSFYKDNAEINKVLGKTIDLARTTPFQVKDLVPAVRSMKAIGSDAYAMFKGAGGEVKELIKYVGDLGAFNPMQGVEGALFAYREALGGNMRSLKMRFDVNPELILGHKMDNSSVEAFNKDFVEFVSKLAPNLTENLYGTFDQLVSNLEDSMTFLKWNIAESGVFDEVKQTIIDMGDALGYFTTNVNYGALKSAFESLWRPIAMIVSSGTKLVKWVADLSNTNPMLMKFVVTTVGLTGGLMALTGRMMQASGGAIILVASISTLIEQMGLASRTMDSSMYVSLGRALGAGKSFFSFLGVAGVALSGLFLAYKYDTIGFRHNTERMTKDFKSSWASANEVMENGMSRNTRFVDALTLKLAKFKTYGLVLGELVTKQFNGRKFDFSETTSKAVLNMGLKKEVEVLVMGMYRARMFAEGLAKGFSVLGRVLINFGTMALAPVNALLKFVGVNLDDLFMSMQGKRTGHTEKYWQEQIKSLERLGGIIGGIVGTMATIKVFGAMGSMFAKPFNSMKKSANEAKESVVSLKVAFKGFKGFLGDNFNKMSFGLPYAFKQTWDRLTSENFVKPVATSKGGYLKNADESHRNMFEMALGHKYSDSATTRYRVARRPNWWRTIFGDKYIQEQLVGHSDVTEKLRRGKIVSKGGDAIWKSTKVGRFGGLRGLFGNKDQNLLRMAISAGYTDSMLDSSVPRAMGARTSHKFFKDFASNGLLDRVVNPLSSAWLKNGVVDKEGFASALNHKIDPYGQAGTLRSIGYKSNTAGFKEYMNPFMSNRNQGKSAIAKFAKLFPEDSNIQRILSKNYRNQFTDEAWTNSHHYDRNASKKVFSEGRKGLMGKLFGSRLFTIDDIDGLATKNYVGRKGGAISSSWIGKLLFRDSTGAYNPNMGLGTSLMRTAPLRMASNMGKSMSNVFNKMPFANTFGVKAGKAFGKAFGVTAGVAKGAWGGMKAVGSGIGNTAKFAGRLGMGALGMLPSALMWGSLAKTGWDMLSTATDKDGNTVTGAKGAKMNLDKMAEAVKKFDFKVFWSNMLRDGKPVWDSLKNLGKQALGKIFENAPAVFEGVKKNGAEAWNWIKTDGLSALDKMFSWVGTDGVTLLIKGLEKLLPWLVTKFLPSMVDLLINIGTSIAGGLQKAVMTVVDYIWNSPFVQGILQVLGFVKGESVANRPAFSQPADDGVNERWSHGVHQWQGLKDKKWYDSKEKAQVHHKGLWLSSNEHEAIIRKDETVLPPAPSKALDAMLKSGGGGGTIIKIDKFTVEVKADNLSRADARAQAIMISEEFEKLSREKSVRRGTYNTPQPAY